MDELKLIDKCKKGDNEAFSKLILSYEKKVYNIALRMVLNPEDAYDVAQEVFLKVYQSIHSFRGQSSFSTWIYRVASNVCLDFLRKKKKHATVISIDRQVETEENTVSKQLEDPSPGTFEQVEQNLMREELAAAITKLSPEHRLVIVYRDINGLSYEEIAQITGQSMGTVKSRLSRARKTLQKLLKNREPFEDFSV